MEVVGQTGDITEAKLNKMKYLKAFQHESQRWDNVYHMRQKRSLGKIIRILKFSIFILKIIWIFKINFSSSYNEENIPIPGSYFKLK